MADLRHQPALTEVRAQHQIDLDKLAGYLSQQLAQFFGSLSARQFKDGQSNPTYLLHSDGGDFVLRKKPPGDLLPGAHRIEREFRIIATLAEHGVPVPAALHLCEDETIIGTPFYVMQHVEGGVCQDPGLPGMTTAERSAIYASMVEVMARLHSIDWQSAGLSDYGKHENYIARQIALWSRQYEAAKTGVIAEMDELMQWLPQNIPAGDETCLVHGDYRLGNLILEPNESRIAGVLDWELSTLGHPLTDLAYNCLPYHLPAGEDDILPGISGADLETLGIPTEDAYIAAYCDAAGRTGGIPEWSFYITFAMFRLASIAQGVYARALQGKARSAKAKDYEKRAIKLAKFAWALQANPT